MRDSIQQNECEHLKWSEEKEEIENFFRLAEAYKCEMDRLAIAISVLVLVAFTAALSVVISSLYLVKPPVVGYLLSAFSGTLLGISLSWLFRIKNSHAKLVKIHRKIIPKMHEALASCQPGMTALERLRFEVRLERLETCKPQNRRSK